MRPSCFGEKCRRNQTHDLDYTVMLVKQCSIELEIRETLGRIIIREKTQTCFLVNYCLLVNYSLLVTRPATVRVPSNPDHYYVAGGGGSQSNQSPPAPSKFTRTLQTTPLSGLLPTLLKAQSPSPLRQPPLFRIPHQETKVPPNNTITTSRSPNTLSDSKISLLAQVPSTFQL